MAGKVKCTCGWSWNKSDSSVKDMYICHECGRDNSNNMKDGGWLDKAQTGKIVPPETEIAKAKRVARKVAGSSGIGLALDQFPGVETAYDLYNIADAYKQGDPMKIIPNVMGALLPGLSGKSFEAISDEYLPKTPKKEKEKFKAVSKGKRANIEEIKKAQESVDWSTGFKKLYDDAGEIGTDIKNTIDDTVSPLMGLKNGGWLDNYNDSEVSLPEGFVGEGIFNGPKFDNPAWGGQFQEGGKLTFLQPTSDKLPEGYVIPYDTPSSEIAMSIGGENGEPAYLIPSFKYGQPLDDPMGEFRKTGEHLGGPFKTWQEADKWENETRHPAVEKGETIMFPQEKFQMGGNMPGAVGHMYARTGSPSKGPRRNQTDVTDASAQNGKEMQYYQNGLDWKPKSISKNGAWLDNYKKEIIKDDRGQWDHPGEITEIGSNEITMEGVPYDVLGVSDTGDTKLMKPGKNYKFKGKKVTEYPMAKNGVNQQDEKTLEQLDQLTNFTNYNKPTIGGWLNKYKS